jgi:hypothetical protein
MTEPAPHAGGGVVRGPAPVVLGESGCALTVPATIACECGATIHVTVNLSKQQIEAAVIRIMNDARRKASYRPSAFDVRR